MRFFFFITENDNTAKPRLHALPNQTFEDGTPVSTLYNVQSPKEAGSHPGGARLDYPTGTVFCSTYLTATQKGNTPFYTVYNMEESDPNESLDFHVVSDDPSFKYVNPSHKDDRMNLAYIKFISFGVQDTPDENKKPSKKKNMKTKKKDLCPGPADATGKAKPVGTFEASYDNQVETETELIVQWMKKVLMDMNIRSVAKRPKCTPEVTEKIERLYGAGESIDTIASRPRMQILCNNQKMDALGLANINKGPLEWYLDILLAEHDSQKDSSFIERNTANTQDVEDAAFIMAKQMDDTFGTTTPITGPVIVPAIAKAIDQGWTIEQMLRPEVFNQKDNLEELLTAITNGAIPLPKGSTGAKSLFETLEADPKNKCPEAKDGFYVNKKDWIVLLRNLKVKQNTILTGPSGSGKTELVKKLCEVTNTPLTIIQMGGVTDVTEHLVGKLDLDPATKGTKFDWAEFALAIQRPGVVLLDEINRIPRGGSNILFSVLDNTRTLHANGAKSTDVREIKVNPDCCFFATANLGDEYVDAHEIDEAIRTRLCAQIPLSFMDIKTEAAVLSSRTGIDKDDATAIAEVARDIRNEYKKGLLQYNASVRETLYTAELVRDGMDVEDALEYGILTHYEKGITDNDPSSEWGKVKALIATHFNNKK